MASFSGICADPPRRQSAHCGIRRGTLALSLWKASKNVSRESSGARQAEGQMDGEMGPPGPQGGPRPVWAKSQVHVVGCVHAVG